jgi:transaldolase
MKIFIDSANIDEIKEAFSWGIVDGITTNPSLIKKAIEYFKNSGVSFTMEEYIKELLKVAGMPNPVSLEVIGSTEEEMFTEATLLFEKFNGTANNVVIKIPVSPEVEEEGTKKFDGLKVIRRLKEKNISVNCTLIMSSNQALLAAKSGAKYVSPFAGRIDDFLRTNNKMDFNKEDYFPEEGLVKDNKVLNDDGIVSGVDLVASIKEIFDNYDFDTEIIAASVRNARQVRELAEVGTHIATIPFAVIKSMIKHPKTSEGMVNFMKDTVEEYRKIFEKT